eukprot:GHVQ01017457.1.p1 GENE.GHVQ01017457.1~~GHVQ01017457.1.p1  ORF type:complete len:1935 (-),score=293.33 GHVQ01017457.1:484-6288(-)
MLVHACGDRWSSIQLETAESASDSHECLVDMHMEFQLPVRGSISAIVPCTCEYSQTWLLQDCMNGLIWSFERTSKALLQVFSSHAKGIVSAYPVPSCPGLVVSTGQEGSIRAWNYTQESQDLFSRAVSSRFPQLSPSSTPASSAVSPHTPVAVSASVPSLDASESPILLPPTFLYAVSCVCWAPTIVGRISSSFPVMVVGFESGVLRILCVSKKGVEVVFASRPFNCAIKQLEYSPDGAFLTCLGENDCLFYYLCPEAEEEEDYYGSSSRNDMASSSSLGQASGDDNDATGHGEGSTSRTSLSRRRSSNARAEHEKGDGPHGPAAIDGDEEVEQEDERHERVEPGPSMNMGLSQGDYSPVGFAQVPEVCSGMTWNDDAQSLLVYTKTGGKIFEYLNPVVDLVSSNETYLMNLDYRCAQLMIPAEPLSAFPLHVQASSPLHSPPSQQHSADGRSVADTPAPSDVPQEASTMAPAVGSSVPLLPGSRGLRERAVGNQEVPVGDSAVTAAVYVERHTCLFAGTHEFHGLLWIVELEDMPTTANMWKALIQDRQREGKTTDNVQQVLSGEQLSETDQPDASESVSNLSQARATCLAEPLLHLYLPNKAQVSLLRLSPSRDLVMIGCTDGRVLLTCCPQLSLCYCLRVGDCLGGSVTDMQMTVDGSGVLLVGAADGGVRSYSVNVGGLRVAAEWMDEVDEMRGKSNLSSKAVVECPPDPVLSRIDRCRCLRPCLYHVTAGLRDSHSSNGSPSYISSLPVASVPPQPSSGTTSHHRAEEVSPAARYRVAGGGKHIEQEKTGSKRMGSVYQDRTSTVFVTESAVEGGTDKGRQGAEIEDDFGVPCLEDAKRQSEEERARAAADRQKRRVRDRVADLRRSYQALKKKNEELLLPLTEQELMIETDYIAQLENEAEAQVAEVEKELAWSTAYHNLGVAKLHHRFLRPVEYERITVASISNPVAVSVATFRNLKLPLSLHQNLARLKTPPPALLPQAAHNSFVGAPSPPSAIIAGDDKTAVISTQFLSSGGTMFNDSNDVEGRSSSLGKPDHRSESGGGRREDTAGLDMRDSGASDRTPGQDEQKCGETGTGAAFPSQLADASLSPAGPAGGVGATEGANPMAAQDRRKLRAARRLLLSRLHEGKPSDTHEDPKDVAAIRRAEATLGDYRMKTAENYKVPQDERMNAEKKRRQMWLLEESVHAIQTEFNNKVLQLRRLKRKLLTLVSNSMHELVGTARKLLTSSVPSLAGLSPELRCQLQQHTSDGPRGGSARSGEYPEQRWTFTESHLKTFLVESIQRSYGVHRGTCRRLIGARVGLSASSEFIRQPSGSGAGQMGGSDITEDGEKEAACNEETKRTLEEVFGGLLGNLSTVSTAGAVRAANGALSAGSPSGDGTVSVGPPICENARKRGMRTVHATKNEIEQQVHRMIYTFDMLVGKLSTERARLQSDLKMADIRLLVLREELEMLSSLEARDRELLKQAQSAANDGAEVQALLKDCHSQLVHKKVMIQQWQEQEQILQAEFSALVDESNPYLGALLKIYKKKVKRPKRRAYDANEGSDSEDSESSVSDVSSSDNNDDDEEMEEDVCPLGCEIGIYESVLELRYKRLDLEGALQDIQRDVEELKKTYTKLVSQEKQIASEHQLAEEEIRAFQKQKQNQLNQVQVILPLKLSQFQCMQPSSHATIGDANSNTSSLLSTSAVSHGAAAGGGVAPWTLPSALTEHVVCTTRILHRLSRRNVDLQAERAYVRRHYRQLQHHFRNAQKHKSFMIGRIETLRQKYESVQLLRFGQLVDLDVLDTTTASKASQALHAKLSEIEATELQKATAWRSRIEDCRSEMLRLTHKNTNLMAQIVDLGLNQLTLYDSLRAKLNNVTVNDPTPSQQIKETELQGIRDLITNQERQISALKLEINMFRQKGGHIYTAVTANRMLQQPGTAAGAGGRA